jgi:hypothetical protein
VTKIASMTPSIPRGTIIGKQVAPLSEAEHFWKCDMLDLGPVHDQEEPLPPSSMRRDETRDIARAKFEGSTRPRWQMRHGLRSYERGRQLRRLQSAHFVSTGTFSVQLHKAHSKVRMSTPSGPDTKPTNIIGPWHFGHGGRSISMKSAMRDCGICCPLKIRRECKTPSHR